MKPLETALEYPFWANSIEDAAKHINSNITGLSSAEADARLKDNGPNVIKNHARLSGVMLFLTQFKSPVSLLLIVAALLSAGLGDAADTIIILVIIFLSAALGFWQESGAANAVEQLLKMVQLRTSVWRDGVLTDISMEEIVPGDVINLSAGDIIPGDCRIITAENLFVDEAAFTGETFPCEKSAGIVAAASPLNKRINTLLMGTHVVSGKAKALVMLTAKQTQFGKLSGSLQNRSPETDFEKGIRRFGYLLMEITLLLVIIIFAINVFLHKPVLDSFLFSLALAVGLTPQLLPAIISVNLSIGAKRMAQKQVIVKRLASIQNFGSMNVLCSDKTGTITQGSIKLCDTINISGTHSDKVLQYAYLNASLQQGFKNPIDQAISNFKLNDANHFTLQSEIPYDFVRKRLTVVVSSDEESLIITKGALQNILSICDRVETESGVLEISPYINRVNALYEKLSGDGLRTLGVACKPTDSAKSIVQGDEHDMIFLGFITLFDPPKPGIADTISRLRQMGVGLKMITGDNALIASNVARQIGLEKPVILTGSQLQNMSNAALKHRAPLTHVFAEIEPNQKERIIMALKNAGYVVGYMGDGINDAPALHAADVGISVNTAVDVAKEAADIVLLSQDLGVLSDGIIEGRKTFANTMKYIFMATSANFGNMFSMAGASLFLPFLPLLPKQILLTNLLTDLPEMTIATDRVDEVNLQRPQHWDLSFIKKFMVIFGLLSSVFDYLTFGILLLIMHANEKTFQTGWFTESVISAALIVLVVRTRLSFFKSLPGKLLSIATALVIVLILIIPFTPVGKLFGFQTLQASYYLWMIAIITAYVLAAEWIKKLFYKRYAKKSSAKRLG